MSEATRPIPARVTAIQAVRSIGRLEKKPHLHFVPLAGTGSYPELPQGWQRNIRLMPNHVPNIRPWTSIASTKYSEQVGVNRHPVPGPPVNNARNGDNVTLYTLSKIRRMRSI